ncbi:membrane protein YqaA, SNARE-associated domain [Mariprofundus ferrinatatus]|uniref:Membrane protein YqaA, SNARE-associated domain n=1 Tax=Mariprofundus ferrinatatus TaxID=1921087 RepID=A0A2K8L3J0_9PROT|nr:YqaA family protein [Mariprofundus ferrinatatus]ATX81900.1 membrane protein YqaA, SNARE-associated domain [Mariprofundus ferrinatatus]
MTEKRRSLLRRLYDWTLAWAEHPKAGLALFFIAVIEASVFPIPPDVLLLLMSISRPQDAFRFAAITTAGSTLGAVIGYAIGMFLFVAVAQPVLEFYHAMETFNQVQERFNEWGVWFVVIAGFSPIPFKIITIAAGAFDLAFLPFIIAAILARAARFYMEAAVMRWGGEPLRNLVEKHFQLLTAVVTIAVIGGFALLWL